MLYNQISVNHRSNGGVDIVVERGVDKPERSNYEASPFLWACPEHLMTEREAVASFVIATVEAYMHDITETQKMIVRLVEAYRNYKGAKQ